MFIERDSKEVRCPSNTMDSPANDNEMVFSLI